MVSEDHGPVDAVEERDSVLGELTKLEKSVQELEKTLGPISYGVSPGKSDEPGGSAVKLRLKRLRLQIVHIRQCLDL